MVPEMRGETVAAEGCTEAASEPMAQRGTGVEWVVVVRADWASAVREETEGCGGVVERTEGGAEESSEKGVEDSAGVEGVRTD